MTTQGLTKKQIRQAVARNVVGRKFIASSPSIAGSTTTLTDNTLLDVERGSWILGTQGTIDGDLALVDLVEQSGQTLTLRPPLSAATTTTHTYEKFPHQYPPSVFTDAIDQAIQEATGLIYPRETSFALHADGRRARFDLPSEFAMVNKVEFRNRVTGKLLHSCGAAFDESVDADFTVTVDTEKYWRGNGSNKFVIAGTVSAGNLVSDSITSKNLSGMTHVEFWIWAEAAVAADDLRIILSSTANGATETEALAVPALTARTDTFVRVALTNPENDTAIISIALEYNASPKANTVFLDDIQAVDENSADYSTLPNRFYNIDRENDDLVLKPVGVTSVGYALLKISGGSIPTLLTLDTSICDIPEEFVIARATALLLMGGSHGRDGDQDDRRGLAIYWDGRANQERRKFPFLTDMKKV